MPVGTLFLEAAPNGVDKGAAIRILAEKLNSHQSEIIALGNAGNELTMVQYAGLGVWVDNVVAEVVRRFILDEAIF